MPAHFRDAVTERMIAIALCRLIAVEIERIAMGGAVRINEVAVRLLVAEPILVIFITAAQPPEGPMEA